MSKGSSQQQTNSRDRAPSAASRPKHSGKSEANGNGAKTAAPQGAAKKAPTDDIVEEFAVIPAESAEEDFFARGEVNSSFPPAAVDLLIPELDELPEVKPLTPAQLERRARLRRIVGGIVGAAAVLTAVVGAKALAAPHTKVTASDGSLNVPHQVVPSIAMAAQEEPAQAKAPEAVTPPDPGTPPSGDPATAAESPTAQGAAAQGEGAQPSANPAAETAAAAPAPTTRRLPVIDVEIPASSDPAIDKQWESAAKNLASKDFKGADTAFAELGKRPDPATREAARLARAVWWTANGRESEVKPVIADLAANATTPSVREHARGMLRSN